MAIKVYLAGPFTAVADSAAGVIDADSPWRRILEATERALGDKGWGVFLPHRDVSRWGLRDAAPEEIATECLEAVLASDCVIAVLGESFGTHVEVGTAIGRSIPTIIIDAAGEAGSFFGKAVMASSLVTCIRLDSLQELPAIVASERFDHAVRSAGVHSDGLRDVG
ncbi:hypothetical protein GCM10009555_050130 [Acrocarpospora macrocephala]|uniref:Nucleoside 2-deoxyribosyltransferase n=1 Tax=Acrocarpospora macrocephala TaxID=150177 RepID=A0A5M3WWU3_9ACTN|nr:hypothetical protein [Acrocarpospora macrocephala]GES12866.1 hypothetical protein Amac_064630 [Acrocarpospora macrocephala]